MPRIDMASMTPEQMRAALESERAERCVAAQDALDVTRGRKSKESEHD